MKTYARVLELFKNLESAFKKGEIDFKVEIFKRMQIVSTISEPLVKIQKTTEEKVEEYRKEVGKILQKYNAEMYGGRAIVPMYLKKEDGAIDFTKPNPDYSAYKTASFELDEKYKSVIETYEKEETEYRKKLDSDLLPADLQKLGKLLKPIPEKLLPLKENKKVDLDEEAFTFLLFGLIKQ